ncbi:uracil-DNA glycosylase [Clavulina sp. PMI_390]|nr:uracil-DNA glycosylase [Clavulina sp. PMI_390]
MYSVSTVPKRQRVSESGEASSSTQPSGQVRLVNGLRPFNSIAFNVDTYKASLSEKEARLLSLECDTMGRTWLKLLGDEIKKPYFLKLKEFLWNAGVQDNREKSTGGDPIYPPPKDIYHWSRATPLGKVKIVIIGQDPYHGPGQAHGLCFSVRKGVAVPPSLRNMYREIQNDYPGFKPPSHGELTNWAESGVLLLNTSLTVKARSAGSHSGKGWEEFTDAIVSLVDKYGGASLSKTTEGVGRGVVFLVWGAHAAKRVSKLSKTKHLILSSVHPSPLSANKGGWFGNQHFRKANDWLEKKYGADAKIDWTKLS